MSVDNSKRLARAILDLAHSLSLVREARSLSIEQLATRTGLAVDDIEMLEEGDVSDVSILLRVIDALDAHVELEPGFHIAVDSKVVA